MNIKQRLCSWMNIRRHAWVSVGTHHTCKYFKSVACGSRHRVQETACQFCEHPFTGKDMKVYKPKETMKHGN